MALEDQLLVATHPLHPVGHGARHSFKAVVARQRTPVLRDTGQLIEQLVLGVLNLEVFLDDTRFRESKSRGMDYVHQRQSKGSVLLDAQVFNRRINR